MPLFHLSFLFWVTVSAKAQAPIFILKVRGKDILLQINKQRSILGSSVNVFTTPSSFYASQIINPFLTSRISSNHSTGFGFQLTGKSLYSLMFLQCGISFVIGIQELKEDLRLRRFVYKFKFRGSLRFQKTFSLIKQEIRECRGRNIICTL